MRSQYRGRFAPSPTGRLHFGSLIAAVASYAQARQSEGIWLVRMEDLDRPREVPGMAAALIEDLAAFGMVSDESIVYQSRRNPIYQQALSSLEKAGLIFPCACSRKQLHGQRAYPGTCRDGLPVGKKARTQRLRVESTEVKFEDLIQGVYLQDLAEVGDFIVRRADRLFAYQLAVVVDDAEQGITEVVRGADLLDSTARQIYLQQLLGYRRPSYCHVPVAVDSEGNKLSKQTFAAPVDSLKPVAGLQSAWRFLGQAELPVVSDVESFWRLAIERWRVQQVPRCLTQTTTQATVS